MKGIFAIPAGETAVVTGGTTGIGYATAELLAEAGCTAVVLHLPGRSLPPDAGDRIATLECDVTDEAQVTAALAACARDHGTPTMLVNCAALTGTQVEAPLLEHGAQLFRQVVDVNLTGQFLVLREAARHMVAASVKGRIVNVTSVRGLIGGERIAAYCAAKAGVVGLTRAAALELAPHGIRVNAVAPGFTDSPAHLAEAAIAEPWRFEKEIPLGIHATPEDIARIIAALLSPESRFVTGAVWVSDGGVTAY